MNYSEVQQDATLVQSYVYTVLPLVLIFLTLSPKFEVLMKMLYLCAGSNPNGNSTIVSSCLGPWESAADFGLGTWFAHMESARKFGESLAMFRRNSEIVLEDSKVDELLTDAFHTEFHLKFLWGSRGACVAAEERHAKFEQVLTVMSEKCEPPQPSTPASPAAPAVGTTV